MTARIITTLIETVPINTIHPHPDNPRRGTVTAIVDSLNAHGQFRPLIVQRSTRFVLAGNHTLAAARQAGMTEIAVTFLDVDDEQARRIMLVDNRTSDLGTYDDQTLLRLLSETSDLTGTGYRPADVEDLTAFLRSPQDAPAPVTAMPPVDEQSPQTSTERQTEAVVRSLVIEFHADEFPGVLVALAKVRREHDVESNRDALIALLNPYLS